MRLEPTCFPTSITQQFSKYLCKGRLVTPSLDLRQLSTSSNKSCKEVHYNAYCRTTPIRFDSVSKVTIGYHFICCLNFNNVLTQTSSVTTTIYPQIIDGVFYSFLVLHLMNDLTVYYLPIGRDPSSAERSSVHPVRNYRTKMSSDLSSVEA